MWCFTHHLFGKVGAVFAQGCVLPQILSAKFSFLFHRQSSHPHSSSTVITGRLPTSLLHPAICFAYLAPIHSSFLSPECKFNPLAPSLLQVSPHHTCLPCNMLRFDSRSTNPRFPAFNLPLCYAFMNLELLIECRPFLLYTQPHYLQPPTLTYSILVFLHQLQAVGSPGLERCGHQGPLQKEGSN